MQYKGEKMNEKDLTVNTTTGEIVETPRYNEIMSVEIDKIAIALSKCQGKIEGAIKDSENPFFKSTYADLSSVWEACRKPLSENGLAITQIVEPTHNEKIRLLTFLLHSSGEWIKSILELRPTKQDPQGYGSCLTYMRRYSLAAIVGIAPEDDDAEAATDRGKNKSPVSLKSQKGKEGSGSGSPDDKKDSGITPPESPESQPSLPKIDIDTLNKSDLPLSKADGLKAFKAQKVRVGDKAYYEVLGAVGLNHANAIKDRRGRVLVYDELKELPDKKNESSETSEEKIDEAFGENREPGEEG
jgi:ERF superfamily